MNRFLVFFIASVIWFILGLTLRFYPASIQQTFMTKENVSPKFDVKLDFVSSRSIYGLHDFSDVVYLSENSILAVGCDGQVPERMRLSNDGGKTWRVVLAPTEGWIIQSADFVNSLRGWAVGDGQILISTTNGGLTWDKTRLPVFMHNMEVKFLNENIGYIAGFSGYYDKKRAIQHWGITILKTTDGGVTWQKSYTDNEGGGIFQVVVLSESIAFVVVDGSNLLRTENGGKTWRAVDKGRYAVSGLSFSPEGTGWLVGQNSFLASKDNGKTWYVPDNVPPSFFKHNWQSINFTKEGIGVAVGEDCAIALTKDRGRTWVDAKFFMDYRNKTNTHAFTETYNDPLRVVRLYGKTGFILGSENVYKISYPNQL